MIMGSEHHHEVKDSCNPQTKISEKDQQLHGISLKACTSWANLQSFLCRSSGCSVNSNKTLVSLLQQSRAAEKKKLVWNRTTRHPNKASPCAQPSHQCQHSYDPVFNLLLQKSRASEGIRLQKWHDCKQRLLAQKHGCLDSLLQKSRVSESIRLKKWHDGKKTIPTQNRGGDCGVQESTSTSMQGAKSEHEATRTHGKEKERNAGEPVLCEQSPDCEDQGMDTVASADRGQRNTSTRDSGLAETACQASSSGSSVVMPDKAPRKRKRRRRLCYQDWRYYKKKTTQDKDEQPQPKKRRLDSSEKCAAAAVKGRNRQRMKPERNKKLRTPSVSRRKISPKLTSSIRSHAVTLSQCRNNGKHKNYGRISSKSNNMRCAASCLAHSYTSKCAGSTNLRRPNKCQARNYVKSRGKENISGPKGGYPEKAVSKRVYRCRTADPSANNRKSRNTRSAGSSGCGPLLKKRGRPKKVIHNMHQVVQNRTAGDAGGLRKRSLEKNIERSTELQQQQQVLAFHQQQAAQVSPSINLLARLRLLEFMEWSQPQRPGLAELHQHLPLMSSSSDSGLFSPGLPDSSGHAGGVWRQLVPEK